MKKIQKTNKVIIAFDLSSSNTGVAIFSEDMSKHLCLSINTKKEKTHSEKLKKLYDKLMELKNSYIITEIICEESFTRFNKSTQVIYKCRGVLELAFWDIKQTFYSPKHVRKVIMGNGNAKKEQVQEFLQKTYSDIHFDDLDQSDAFAVGLCYFKEREG